MVSEQIPVIFYNTARSKKIINPRKFKDLLPDMPRTFVGTKTTTCDFFNWCEYRYETPDLVHIVLESIAAPALMSEGKAFISPVLGGG